MRAKLGVLASGLLAAGLMSAHHSGAAVFDHNKKIGFTGVVTKMEWVNPHAHFYLDVKDATRQSDELEPGAGESEYPGAQWVDADVGQRGRHGDDHGAAGSG